MSSPTAVPSPSSWVVSIESPIGRSLMKHKVGDRVYIKINDSDGYYAVIRNIDKSDDESEKISSY